MTWHLKSVGTSNVITIINVPFFPLVPTDRGRNARGALEVMVKKVACCSLETAQMPAVRQQLFSKIRKLKV
jgi:hypothetical protein